MVHVGSFRSRYFTIDSSSSVYQKTERHKRSRRSQTSLIQSQILMKRLNGGSAFSDGGGNPLHRATANVTHCEDAGPARLQIMRRAVGRPPVDCIGASEHKAVLV